MINLIEHFDRVVGNMKAPVASVPEAKGLGIVEHRAWRNRHPVPSFLERDLANSGLSIEDVNISEFISSTEGYEILYMNRCTNEPYRCKDGSIFSRTKLQCPIGKTKYRSKKGAGIKPYVLPVVHKHIKEDAPEWVFVTEGEKKAITATKCGFPVIGIGGIWMWMQEKGDKSLNDELVPYLSNRKVVMIYDSDSQDTEQKRKNFDVCVSDFATALTDHGSTLYRVDLPKVGEGKTGLDDLIMTYTDIDFDLTGIGCCETPIDIMREAISNIARYISANIKLVRPTVYISEVGTETTDTEKIKARFFDIFNDSKITDKGAAMSDVVLDFLLNRGKLYFHSILKTFDTSMFFDSQRHVLLKISSDEFKSWLADYTCINRADNKYKYIFSGIETASLNDKLSQGIIPARFWQGTEDMIYISNGDGQVIRISAGKYEVCSNGVDGVLFEAGYTLKKFDLTASQNPFESSLFKNASYSDPTGYMLLQLYALSLPTNPRCKPPLVLTSPVGGGKTRTAVGICEVFGIKSHMSKVLKEGEKDFWTGIADGGILIMDNADTKTEWLADALATASTGIGQPKRKLYTDSTMIDLDPKSWPIVTSANPTFATDAGLADRTLLIRLKRRYGETADNLLTEEINKNRDAGMSFICEILSRALADTLPTPKALNKRHPDFASFAVKIGRALGKEQEAIQALQAAELDKSKFNLENDDIGSAILSYMGSNEKLEGTTAEILEALRLHNAEFNDNDFWTPKKAGIRLVKLEAHLSELFKFCKTVGHNNAKISISKRSSSVSSVSSGAVLPKVHMKEKVRDFSENEGQDTEDADTKGTNEIQVTSSAAVFAKGTMLDRILNFADNSELDTAITTNKDSFPFDDDGKCQNCGFLKEYKYQVNCPDCLRKVANL